MLVLSHNVFARKGDKWNAHPEREQFSTGLRMRVIRGPSWNAVEQKWRVEGYGPDGDPGRAVPRPEWTEPVKLSQGRDPELVKAANAALRQDWVEPREHYRRREEVRGSPKPLTEEQLQLRKKQRAQRKARLTRAENRLRRERETVLSILEEICHA
jgi:hypothetical protein